MTVGVPKEIKGQEYRVALLPSAAYQLIKRGHQVVFERGAGAGAGLRFRLANMTRDPGRGATRPCGRPTLSRKVTGYG